MEKRQRTAFLLMILLLFTSLAFTACSEKITSAGEQEIDLRIDLSSSGLDATVATTFILTVSGPGIADPIVESLVFSNGFLTGTVIVPAGPARIFRIEALDNGSVLIYSGETVADVVSGEQVSLSIDLHPRVPMVKVSPMYAVKPMGSVLPIKIKVFNIENLNVFEGRLYNYGMTSEYTYPLREVILNPAFKDVADLISSQLDNFVQFKVTHRFGGSLTDIDGFADLLTINISTPVGDMPEESVRFYPGIVSMMDTEENIISPKDIYLEDAQVDLYYYASSIVAEWKMGWGTGSEDPSWIEDTSPNLLHGTATGTEILEGAYGNARYFNGYGDFIEIPDDDLLDLEEGITVAFWLDIQASIPMDAKLPSYFPPRTILSKRSEDGAVNYKISIEDLSVGDANFSMLFSYGSSTVHTYRADIPEYMLDGWNHYIFSYQFGDSSSALLVTFWDGVVEIPGAWVSGDGTAAASVTSGPLLIGKDNAEMTQYYTGGIDDIELFDAAFDIYLIEWLYAW